MDDVEFRVDPTPGPGDDLAEDVVEVEPRRIPRWLIVLGCVAAVALVVASLALRVRSNRTAALPTEVPAPTAVASGLAPLPVSTVGPTVAREGNEIALDMTLAGNLLYTLRRDELTITDAARSTVLDRVHVTGLDYFYGGPTMHLFVDPSTFTAWVLSENVFPQQILEFNSSSLRERRTVVADDPVYAAAILDGRLYMATTRGISVLQPRHGKPTMIARTTVPVQAIAADPARDRLLAVDGDIPQHVMAISPDGTTTAHASTRLVSPEIAVAGDRIWVAGFGYSAPVVRRLDPVTLAAQVDSPVAGRAGVGAHLVAGERVVWVSAGIGDPKQLWCVDADTGAIGGYWPGLSGSVSSHAGLAYAVLGGEAVILPTGSTCPG